MLESTEPGSVWWGPLLVSDQETLEPSRSQALKANCFHLNTSPIPYSCMSLGELFPLSEHVSTSERWG